MFGTEEARKSPTKATFEDFLAFVDRHSRLKTPLGTSVEIAKEFDCSRTTIARWVKKAIREHGWPLYNEYDIYRVGDNGVPPGEAVRRKEADVSIDYSTFTTVNKSLSEIDATQGALIEDPIRVDEWDDLQRHVDHTRIELDELKAAQAKTDRTVNMALGFMADLAEEFGSATSETHEQLKKVFSLLDELYEAHLAKKEQSNAGRDRVQRIVESKDIAAEIRDLIST